MRQLPLMTRLRADPLAVALGVSSLLHLGLLMIPLTQAQPALKVATAAPLEVILLNAKRAAPPPNSPAQALAQSNWAGGGDAESGRARSPQAQNQAALPPSRGQAMTEQLSQLEQQQQALLQQIKPWSARASEPVQKALAEIEQRIQEENARPRKRYLGPSTREVAYAEYYDRLRRRIEAQGTRHFPTHQGKRLYGALTLMLTVDARGRMVSTELIAGSGQAELDRRARSIANSAAPFGDFSADMKRQADQLAWVIRFSFSAQGVQTEWHEPDRHATRRQP